MIDISKIETFGWEAAIRGMRNSYASWVKSDSEYEELTQIAPDGRGVQKTGEKRFRLGSNDLKLASCLSKLSSKEYSIDDFSHGEGGILSPVMGIQLLSTVNSLNELRTLYLNEDDLKLKKMYWYDIIQLLPEGYNQLRTVDMNYEVVAHMVNDRLYHKLDEWQEFCRKMMANLPYAKELILDIEAAKDE